MKKQHIPASLRRRVRAQAQYRCGYCLRAEELVGERMTLEQLHLASPSRGTPEISRWRQPPEMRHHIPTRPGRGAG